MDRDEPIIKCKRPPDTNRASRYGGVYDTATLTYLGKTDKHDVYMPKGQSYLKLYFPRTGADSPRRVTISSWPGFVDESNVQAILDAMTEDGRMLVIRALPDCTMSAVPRLRLRGGGDFAMGVGDTLTLVCAPDCKCEVKCTCPEPEECACLDPEKCTCPEWEGCVCGYVCPCERIWLETSRTQTG